MKLSKDGTRYFVEWHDSNVSVFKARGMDESDIAALRKLEEAYAGLPPDRQAEMRGALWLLEDGLSSGHIEESGELLVRIFDEFSSNHQLFLSFKKEEEQ